MIDFVLYPDQPLANNVTPMIRVNKLADDTIRLECSLHYGDTIVNTSGMELNQILARRLVSGLNAFINESP